MKTKFGKDEKLVLLIVSIYTLASTMVTTFANVYLLDYTNSLIVISIYSMIRYSVLGLFAYISAKLSTKTKMTYSLVIGLILITSAVVYLLQVKDLIASNHSLVYLVGFIWGAGEGFFWISINSLHQIVTTLESRASYLGINGALNNLMTIVAPMVSSFILSFYLVEIDGYFTMFKVAIAIFIVIAIIALFISSACKRESFSLKNSIKDIKTDISWRYVAISQFVWGIRDAATVSLTGLLIYEAVGSGSVYGQWLSLFALIATISYYLIGRVVKKKNRIPLLVIGSIGLFCSGISLILFKNTFGAFTHGLLHYTFLAWAYTPFSLIAMNIIGNYAHKENVMRRTVIREIAIALGRGVGLLIVIIFSTLLQGSLGLNVGLLILYLFCLIFAWLAVFYDKKIDIS